MRRVAPILLVAGMILMVAPAAFGGETTKNAKDLFTNVGYGGNDGNRNWTGDWKEEGENNGPGAGLVRSVSNSSCPEGSNCLLIKGGGLLSSVAAKRFVDTSDLVDTEFSYKIRRYDNSLLSLDPPRLYIEVTDDGVNWDEVASYDLDTDDESYIYQSHGVEGLASTTFGVRFRVSDILPTTDVGVYIDFIEVRGVIPASTTTTTSTSSTTSTLPTTTTSLPITTTLPTITTTSLPGLLTTSTSTTTTSAATGGTTSTTIPGGGSATTSTSGSSSSDGGTGSSTDGSTTSTTEGSIATTGQEGTGATVTPGAGDGLREAAFGIQAAFDGGRFGEVGGPSLEVMGISIEPNYSMAVEVIESSWVYLLVLILLIATAIVSGLDRRRLKRAKHTDV